MASEHKASSSSVQLSAAQVKAELTALRAKWAEHSQAHVFAAFDDGRLNDTQSAQLLADVKSVDVGGVARILTSINEQKAKAKDEFKPFDHLTVKATASDDTKNSWRDRGLNLVANGKVALVLLAGGQGTRLGSTAPKGCYDIGLLSHKSLYQIQAERIVRLKHLAAQKVHGGTIRHSVPWYIMTSDSTREPSMEFFRQHKFFGLPEADVHFFDQEVLPALTNEGKVIMQTISKISLAPNGNGGLYGALKISGALDDMTRRGITHVHVYGVDNVLVLPGDPYFVGFVDISGADCANKVVLRTNPAEKVGAMCYRNGRPSVVEYSEIDKSLSEGKDSAGNLLLNQANIVNHVLTLPLLKKLATESLPFHIAVKDIPSVDSKGTSCTVSGIKMEMFVFDSFPFCDKMVTFAVERNDEFSAVKNANGVAGAALVSDSPDTARRDVYALHNRYLRTVGAVITGDGPVEISPLTSYAGDGLESVMGTTIEPPKQINPPEVTAASL